MTNSSEKWLADIAALAVKIQKETKVPSKLMVAQGAVESKWGAKPAGNANYFGIKLDKRHTKFCLVPTHENLSQQQLSAWNLKHLDRKAKVVGLLPDGRVRVVIQDEFADYDSLEASCEDYAYMISTCKPYAKAWGEYCADGDEHKLLQGVAGVYATAVAYADLVWQIANQKNVLAAIAAAASVNAML